MTTRDTRPQARGGARTQGASPPGPSARREIVGHAVTRFADGRMYLALSCADGTSATIQTFSPQEAMMLLDILRNEKPVYLDAAGTLYTGSEPAGDRD